MSRSVRMTIITIAATAGIAMAAALASGGGDALSNGKGPVPNPDAGLTDAQRHAKYAASRASFEAHLAAWYADLDASSLDLRALQRGYIMASYVDPLQDLYSAVNKANTIVVGTVARTTPDSQGALVVLNVERRVKDASAGPTVIIRQGSGVFPGPDWKTLVIKDGENDPLLLPGERVILFLVPSDVPGADFQVQSFTGHYTVDSGRVRALAGNPFGASIDKLPEQAFIDELAATVERTR